MDCCVPSFIFTALALMIVNAHFSSTAGGSALEDRSAVVFVRSAILKSWDGFESKEVFCVASHHEMNSESSAVERNGGPVRFRTVKLFIRGGRNLRLMVYLC